MKRILILFYYSKKKLSISRNEINYLKKKYSEIIIYNKSYKYNSYVYEYNNNKLNNIKSYYEKLNIKINIKKIYEINLFLEKIKDKFKNKKIIVSPYFMSGIILEEEFIFYELSKIFKLQFVRPELSFIKNRFILAKNLFKQPYILKKKTHFTKKDYLKFKIKYTSSFQLLSDVINRSKIRYNLQKILAIILGFFFNLKLIKKPNKYILVILNNNKNLEAISRIFNLRKFINLILNKFNYELIFLLHPNTNIFKFFLKIVKNKNFFFQHKRVFFLQKPKNLTNIIQNSKFIIHLSSSLSAQSLIFNKKILCLGKNVIYIDNITNVISNIKVKNFKFLKKKINKADTLKSDKFIIKILSNSVNIKGELKLSDNIKDDLSIYLNISKKNEVKIIQNLLTII